MKKSFFIVISLFLLFISTVYLSIPKKLFDVSYSSLLFDRSGNLLSAVIADDELWRFPESNYDIPLKYEKALLAYEDSRFFYHFGVDFFSVIRAAKDNFIHGKVVSGASTITMQVARLSRGNSKRNFINKFKEAFLALSIEMHYSKKSILKLYASNAPFGGNITGYEAASWFYFKRAPGELSWGESALLAVLPNSPSLIHPGRNRDLLLRKRNRLLKKLFEKGLFDKETYELSSMEPLPARAEPFENHALHFLYSSVGETGNKRILSDINRSVQIMLESKVKTYSSELKKLNISNVSVVILDNFTGNTVAYVGNFCTGAFSSSDAGCFVDIARSKRSSGSILKPFLYLSMLNDGEITPDMLLPDIPVNYNGYSPENFDMEFRGAVSAMEALRLSLNVPAVRLLKIHGIDKFKRFLNRVGFKTIDRDADNYGLSLILGGAEVTLYDTVKAYSDMASSLIVKNDRFLLEERAPESPFINMRGASYIILDALTKLKRPGNEEFWNVFLNKHKIGWKTGTSFGFRDAWAVGVSQKYSVGVWVGNANGESNNALTGAGAAAPLLFDVFGILKDVSWFDVPESDLKKIEVCRESGFPSNTLCKTKKELVPVEFIYKGGSPYYKSVHLNEFGFQSSKNCNRNKKLFHKTMFVLPPAMEFYYRKNHPEYKVLPPFDKNCEKENDKSFNENIIEITYPVDNGTVFLPVNISGVREAVVGQVFYKNGEKTLFWHMDGKYIGTTQGIHKLSFNVDEGNHFLMVVDEEGNMASSSFDVK